MVITTVADPLLVGLITISVLFFSDDSALLSDEEGCLEMDVGGVCGPEYERSLSLRMFNMHTQVTNTRMRS